MTVDGSEGAKRHAGGPFEDAPWPTHLVARVVGPGPRPTIHGYDVDEDLATNYSFCETVLLTLLGELPDEGAGKVFELCLAYLAPVAISEGPANAAVLARVCAARSSSVIAVGAMTLTEQARVLVAEHEGLGDWSPAAGPPPAAWCAASGDDRARASRFQAALGEVAPGLSHPLLLADPSTVAAVFAVLSTLGIRSSAQLETVLVLARLATVVSEALAVRPGSYRDYPLTVPQFRYVEGRSRG